MIRHHLAAAALLSLCASGPATAATTLSAGDIVITGVNADNPDQFVFVTLVDLQIDTQILFTDSGVRNDGSFRASEGAVRYTAPGAIAAGTAISYEGIGGAFSNANDANVGNNGMFLSASGDQVIAFQGDTAAPTFIFAVQTNSTQWQSDATSSTTSALPPGLSAGTSAVAVGSGAGSGAEFDNAEYLGTTSGTATELLAAVANAGNWVGDNARINDMEVTDFTLTDGGGGSADTTAPELVATLPADGAVGIALDSLISVEFSEPVSTSDASLTLDCGSGALSIFALGSDDGGITQEFAPQFDLPANASCLATVVSNEVSDGSNNMTSDVSFVFDTGAPAAAQTLPYSEDFSVCDPAGWDFVSIDSDTARTWECGNDYAEANAFGGSAPANDWLITPALDLDAQEGDILRFRSYSGFTDADFPQLAVLYSSDYIGDGNPAAATWIEIPAGAIDFPTESSFEFADSGDIDISGIAGDRVHFAFVYTTSGTASGTSTRWRLDDVEFTTEPGDGGGGGDPIAGDCGTPATLISTIQGNPTSPSWPITPELGNSHSVEAIVIADFQGTSGMRGFFIQEEDADQDGDAASSEGIFVFDGDNPSVDVTVGDRVRVTGNVSEFNNNTQLSGAPSVEVCDSGNPLPTVTNLTLPEAVDGDLEQVEGMLVRIGHDMMISQTFFLGRYGQMTLASPDDQGVLERLFNPTHLWPASTPNALAVAEENARRLLVLDDAFEVNSFGDNPSDVPFIGPANPDGTAQVIRAGDIVRDLVGVIDEGAINSPTSGVDPQYRIQPTSPPTFVPFNPRTASPEDVGGTLKVAAYNVLNFFNGDGIGGGFPTARGADTQAELDRQGDKTVTAIISMNADILGLMEIENDGFGANSAIAELTDRINAIAGAGTYDYVNPGLNGVGSDAIAVGFIYKPSRVAVVSSDIRDNGDDLRIIETKNRVPLAATFRELASNEVLTVIVNHFKSKGSDCDTPSQTGEIVDPDTGDGQGNCNLTRVSIANAIIDWVQSGALSADDDYLVMGDLNAYGQEDPIQTFKVAGFTDLSQQFIGPHSYTFTFDGQAGSLDHALASATLADQVTGVTKWHISTDEPAVLDYNSEFNGQPYYSVDPFRASDHDPIIIGVELSTPLVVPGDLTGEGDVTLADRDLFRAAYGSADGDARWNPEADYDGNGRITYSDYRLWYRFWVAAGRN